MGKRIRAQKVGRGYYPYKVGKKHKKPSARLPSWPELREKKVRGRVLEILHGRNTPLSLVKLLRSKRNVVKWHILAAEGVYTGKKIEIGKGADLSLGNAKILREIPEGIYVYNIERDPMDGGQIARSSGTYAIIGEHDEERGVTKLELPGKRRIEVNSDSMAQIGVAAGTNRQELPMLKAGNVAHKYKARPLKWPRTRAAAMNPVDHPFGGGRGVGRAKTSSRNAPPGAKVGSIAARRGGKKKK